MSHWWTPSNWLFALTPGEYHKSTISQGGGGSIIDKNIYFIFIFIFKQKCVTVLHTKISCFRTRDKELLNGQTKIIKEY